MSGTPQEPAAEPSMEEILSSIRRILKDDETVTMPAGSTEPGKPVLSLDSSMIVEEGKTPAAAPAAEGNAAASSPTLSSATPAGMPTDQQVDTAAVMQAAKNLVGSQTAEATASHIGALVRTISADRSAGVSRSGATIEDLVREEIRPLLKDWLDTHLPGLVERIVRSEIERLIGRDI